MKVKKILPVLFVALLAVGMMPCGAMPGTIAEAAASDGDSAFARTEAKLDEALAPLPDENTEVKVGAIVSNLSNSFWVTMKHGFEDAAAEYGAKATVMACKNDNDTQGQADIMDIMLGQDYDAICVSPLTTVNIINSTISAGKSGVPVITIGNRIDEGALERSGGQLPVAITSDFKAQGTMQAQYVIRRTGGKGKVAVIEGTPGATQSDARRDGAREAFENAGMTVLPIQTGKFDRQTAFNLANALVEANPDILGIVCGNDDMALGVVEALKAKGIKDEVIVCGIDFTSEAKESIEAGELDASVAMSPYLYGKAGMICALKLKRGDHVPSPIRWSSNYLVTSENVGSMAGWK